MKKILAIVGCVCSFSAYAATKMGMEGMREFKTQVAGDPDLGAFEASPLARDILAVHGLKAETYKERLYGAFLAFKTEEALTAAGHAPASHSHGDIKAAVEALHVDRDTHQTNHGNLTARIQPHAAAGEIVAAVAVAATPLHSHAKHTADVVAAEARGREQVHTDMEARIESDGVEDVPALARGAGRLYSPSRRTADVAAAEAAVRTATHAQLVTLMGHVNGEDAGAVSDEAKGRIRGWVNDMITALHAGEPIPAPGGV